MKRRDEIFTRWHRCVVNCLRQFHLQALLRRLKLTLRFRQMVREKLPKIRILITKRLQCQIHVCTTKLVVRSQTDNCTCGSCENWSGCANPMDKIIQYFWCTLCEQRRYPPTHLVKRTWTVESAGRGRMKSSTGSFAHITYTNPYTK